MKTITVKVPEFLNARLEEAAAGRRVSKSAVIRDTLLQALSGSVTGRKIKSSIHARLSKYQGAGGTGVKDLASNPKHLAAYGRK
jgi:Arc/MetJ-type ribon-helix-helix transcriptional regulator